jgi:hypothetical protein
MFSILLIIACHQNNETAFKNEVVDLLITTQSLTGLR